MFDSSVRKQTLSEIEKKEEEMNQTVNKELLSLVNVLLHASYQFIFLSSLSKTLEMPGISWMTMKKDGKCRDGAVTILDWISANRGENRHQTSFEQYRFQYYVHVELTLDWLLICDKREK